jgi:uncharacterized protein YecE (DUF72 family)
MEFGRVSDASVIDFTFPEDHPGSIKVLGGVKASHCSVYVGCPIWADPGFVGTIYPSKAKSKDFPKYYGQQFNSIELNISHYKILEQDQIQHWSDLTPGGFKFCPKAHKDISHTPLIRQNAGDMKTFLETQKHFKQKLGLPFLQLPPNYDSSKINDLLDFMDEVATSHYAVELRHESWFKNSEVLNRICNYFYKNHVTFLMTDTAGRRDVFHQRLTSKKAFIRFVANDLESSDYIRMNEWIIRLKHWIDNGLEELYFFIHTPNHVLMPDIAIYFITEFNKQTGLKIKLPKLITYQTDHGKLF